MNHNIGKGAWNSKMYEVNDSLFTKKVDDNGIKFGYISDKLGITRYALIKKRKGLSPFKISEINQITELLHLSADERDDIFGLRSPQ